MSIVDIDSVYDFLEIEDDINAIADTIHNATESLIQTYCGRTFEATDYKEFYNGKGSQKLLLKNFPIINIKGVYLSTLEVMKIYNSNKYTNATISVDSTGINLEYNDNTTSGDFTFASNTTLGALETAINNAGSGWIAEVYSDYDTIISTELLEIHGQNAINSNAVELIIPYNYLSQDKYKCDFNNGIIYFAAVTSPYTEFTENPLFIRDYKNFVEANDGTFSVGFNNIFMKYRAGYEEENMPFDLKLAILMICKDLYDRQQESSIGISEYNLSQVVSKSFDKGLINEKSLGILNKYRNINI